MIEKLIQIFGPVRMAMFGTVLIIALGIGGLFLIVWADDAFRHQQYLPAFIVAVVALALIYLLVRLRNRNRTVRE
jgi:hypothetical protein